MRKRQELGQCLLVKKCSIASRNTVFGGEAGNSRKKYGVLHIRTWETLIHCVFQVENASRRLCAPQRTVIFLSKQMIEFLMCAALKSGSSLYAKKQKKCDVREVIFLANIALFLFFLHKDLNNRSFQRHT